MAALSVEGVSKSAIARAKRIGWNTVDRWLEKAAACCRRFNDAEIRGLEIQELQADEIRTIVGGKEQPVWIFNAIEVWSRLWTSTVVGRRNCRNTRALLRDVPDRSRRDECPLIVTDGFEFYRRVVREVFGPTCLYGQVIKTRRNDRVVKVERELIHGASWKLERALADSEDSSTLNTSFVERLNLTIRPGSAYLGRRSLCHPRWRTRLEDHLELLRCHYNFVRPPPSVEVRQGDEDPGEAGWPGEEAADFEGRLLPADLFTVEVARPFGLVTYYGLFVMELSTRRIQIAGVTPNPDGSFMVQVARNLADAFDGFLLGKRYLILDRDSTYTEEFRQLLSDSGTKTVRLPIRSPNLNAYAERFVLSIKSECLDRMIFFTYTSLRRGLSAYASHYHRERNHQGLGNGLIEPQDVGEKSGRAIRCRERLGGMLRYYYRAAA